MDEKIEMLIKILKMAADKNTKVMLLENFIAEYGPIPDKYGEKIRKVIEGE